MVDVNEELLGDDANVELVTNPKLKPNGLTVLLDDPTAELLKPKEEPAKPNVGEAVALDCLVLYPKEVPLPD